MEPKKTEKADLTNKSWLFFNIGLVITLLIVVMAFEYASEDDSDAKNLAKNQNIVEEILEVPPTEQPPPPPPKIQQPQIIEVPDEEEIKEEIKVEFDVEVTENTKVEEIVIAPVEEKEDVDQIFLVVEETATPKGGMGAFYKYVGDKMKYPAQARRMGIEGKVFVEFVINRDGSITDVKAIKGIGAGCDEEAVRVVQSAPPWNPGKQRGKPVRQRYVVPITFKLG
ncbi:MAG TPA: energy transducer TonB [Cyclobacteriaceae bacterium]|nr:energy transducer TonB [Cyclobacteriaceae bacterium]HRJ82600.1 energy transducer TonB [Cyclobacteriaceae bacterium]